MKQFLIIAFFLTPTLVFAQGYGQLNNDQIALYDEGVFVGNVTRINCVGSSISCAKSGLTGIITLTGSSSTVYLMDDSGNNISDDASNFIQGNP